jgi:hypothetical protein
VKDGEYQDRSQTLLEEQVHVESFPPATNFVIVMEATKEQVGELLLRPRVRRQRLSLLRSWCMSLISVST